MGKMVLSDATDAQLLDQFREEQNDEAFADLIQRHRPMVQAVAARLLECPEDVDDAAQATFFAMARLARRIRSHTSVAGWLYKTATTCAIEVGRANNRWRKRAEAMRNSGEVPGEQGSSEDDPAFPTVRRELQSALHEELRQLPDKLRTVIVLCELEGLTHTEAAERMGIPASTVSSRIVKARHALRDRMTRRGVAITLAGITACLSSVAYATPQWTAGSAIDLARSARMYAAGFPAKAIGVSTEVIQLANKVASTIAKTTMICCAVAFIVTGAISSATSYVATRSNPTETYSQGFVDTFFHEPVQYKDVPIEWNAWPSEPKENVYDSKSFVIASHVAFQSGKLIVSGRTVASAGTADFGTPVLNLSDMSIRCHVRLQDGLGVFINPVRNHFSSTPGYYGIVGDNYAVIRYGGIWKDVARCTTDLRVTGKEIIVQFDTIGDELTLWAWPVGQEKPETPLLQIVDTKVPTTARGDLYIGAIGPNARAEFHYVHVAEEPIRDGETTELICRIRSGNQ